MSAGIESYVPSKWDLVTFDDLKRDERYSFVGGPFGSNLTTRDYESEPGVPVIRGVNLDGKQSRFIDDGFVYVSDEKADSLVQNMAYPGDMIFTQRGTLGQIAQIPHEAAHPRYVISQSQMKIAVDESKAHPRYLYYYYRSPLAVAYLQQRVLATGVPHINLSILKEFPVPLPPLEEQRRIAAILDKADAIRRKRQQAIDLTDQLLRSAFLDMFGDPVTNPKGWPMGDFAAVVKDVGLRNGLSPSSKGDVAGRVLTLSAITRGHFDPTAVKDALFVDKPKDKIVDPHDFLICRGNGNLELVGRGHFPTQRMDGVLFPDTMIGARVNPERVNPLFLEALWSTRAVRLQLERGARTTNGTHKINQQVLKSLQLLLPPNDLQERFAKVVRSVQRLRHRQVGGSEGAELLFNSLVQRAFRGEL